MKILKILAILMSLNLGSCAPKNQENHTKPLINEDIEVSHEYSEINDYLIGWNNIFRVNSTDYFVYCFSLTCSHCSEIKNYVIEKALNLKNIYFVKESSQIQLSIDISSTIGAIEVENVSILGYPSLLQIKDKKLIRNLAGKTQIKGILDYI